MEGQELIYVFLQLFYEKEVCRANDPECVDGFRFLVGKKMKVKKKKRKKEISEKSITKYVKKRQLRHQSALISLKMNREDQSLRGLRYVLDSEESVSFIIHHSPFTH
jgi:hypothetical protein